MMGACEVVGVPRYFEPYVNDCIHNAYSAVVLHMGFKPEIVLSDHLSFMFNRENGFIGTNFIFRYSVSVQFNEEELNTSNPFAYFPATAEYSESQLLLSKPDMLNIHMFYHDDTNVADERLKTVLRSGKAVVVLVDLFHMPFHRAYGKEHGFHAIVVTGYEDDSYLLFDKYKISNSDFDGALSSANFIAGRTSDCPVYNPLAGHYNRPIRNLWMEMYAGDNFRSDELDIHSAFRESCERMLGRRRLLGQDCGIGQIDELRKFLISWRNAGPMEGESR